MPTQQTQNINNASFDFKMKNLNINFVGVSVSDPNPDYHISDNDTVYVMNKNTRSVAFRDIAFKDCVLRNRFLSASEKNLVTVNTRTEKDGDYVVKDLTFWYKDTAIGILTLRYAYSYFIQENTLILPFQSFPIQATYTVLDPGKVIQHYYGKSFSEPKRKTGTMDVNFVVKCETKDGEAVNEDITISVNLINGGFKRGTTPVDDSGDGGPTYPAAGTVSGYTCNGCFKITVYHDGQGGSYQGTPIEDDAYCGCTPQRTTAWRPKESSAWCETATISPSPIYVTIQTENSQYFQDLMPDDPNQWFNKAEGYKVDLRANFWLDAAHTQPANLNNQNLTVYYAQKNNITNYNYNDYGTTYSYNYNVDTYSNSLTGVSGSSAVIATGVYDSLNRYERVTNQDPYGNQTIEERQLEQGYYTYTNFPVSDGVYVTSPTGKKGYDTLEQYYTDDNTLTGLTKPNTVGDPNYVAPASSSTCPTRTPVTSMTPMSSIKVYKLRTVTANRTQSFPLSTPFTTDGGVAVDYFMEYDQPTQVIVNMESLINHPNHPGQIWASINHGNGQHTDIYFNESFGGADDRVLGTFTNITSINFSNNW